MIKKLFSLFTWLLSGMLISASWPMSPFTVLVFFAWVPLMVAEEKINNRFLFFFIVWADMLCWNLGAAWWLWNASPVGAISALILNSLLMCLPWIGYRLTKQKIGRHVALLAFVAYWLMFEYFLQNWDLGMPWLTMGNVFSLHPEWIQWYSLTGTAGGSLWVLAVNVLFYRLYIRSTSNQKKRNYEKSKRIGIYFNYALPFVFLLSPCLFSFIWGKVQKAGLPEKSPGNIVIVQPNIDPYSQKYSSDQSAQTAELISLSESKIDTCTRLVLWPETAVPVQACEGTLLTNPYFKPIFAFLERHPQVNLITGIDSYAVLGDRGLGGMSVRHDRSSGNYYEAYSTALGIGPGLSPQFYHKSKLVPGVESLPSWLAFMGSLFDDLGGIKGTLGRSPSPVLFNFDGCPYVAAPIICYESIYGGYVGEFARKGANIIMVLSNDGWWGDTPGYMQHESMGRLRAIETGCWVVRSANTGISCFIDPTGKVVQSLPWDTAAAIKMDVPIATRKTFYARNGDWISKIACVVGSFLMLWALVVYVRGRKDVRYGYDRFN